MEKLKINTYTDESGQDTNGKTFVVCTIVVSSEKVDKMRDELLRIEDKSGKNKKWYDTGDRRRHKYIKILLEESALDSIDIFYSEYKNKLDYIHLIGSHIAKTIMLLTGDRDYISKIFIDKMDKKKILNLTKEIKLFHIRYKKIRGLSEESDPFIRLADTLCGMTRDMNNKKIPDSYKSLFSKIKKV